MIPDGGRSPLQEDPPFELVKDVDGIYTLRQKIEEA